ncbi:hypothetical protein [Anaerosporobacter sp.]|uniref:hypothetical protein n=1 Tax=Anaerosporobacter sp. TaxID=1872529 RepID=UPI00286F2C78|nr:hypothetical protein [Anaerosporobacter sp.]
MSVIRKGRRRIAKRKAIIICATCLGIGSVGILGGSILYKKTISKNQESRNIPYVEEMMQLENNMTDMLESNNELSTDFPYEIVENVADDLRKHVYHFIEITDALCSGDYVDVRIQFPNGSDYIVLSKKRVLACSRYDEVAQTENSLWLEVSEEEILMLSSAAVDAYFSGQANIYAIQYISQNQKEAVVTYPENDVVSALIQENPNVVKNAIAHMENRTRERVTMQVKEYASQGVGDVNTTQNVKEGIGKQEEMDYSYIDTKYVD